MTALFWTCLYDGCLSASWQLPPERPPRVPAMGSRNRKQTTPDGRSTEHRAAPAPSPTPNIPPNRRLASFPLSPPPALLFAFPEICTHHVLSLSPNDRYILLPILCKPPCLTLFLPSAHVSQLPILETMYMLYRASRYHATHVHGDDSRKLTGSIAASRLLRSMLHVGPPASRPRSCREIGRAHV